MISDIDKLISISKQRGFFFISSEIYDGLSGVYDYGPLGSDLINRIKWHWYRDTVQMHKNIFPFDASILMSPKVWETSGHTNNFKDPYFELDGIKYRADHFLKDKTGIDAEGKTEEEIEKLLKENLKEEDLPKGAKLDDIKVLSSNLLVKTNIKKDDEEVFLRGETCQGIYVNFKNILETTRAKIPFGVAQIGKAFRNEISPRRFLFRTREFEQMELQYFVNPKETDSAYDYWKERSMNWLLSIGINKDLLRYKEHEKLVFYAKKAEDIEFNFPSFGWSELEGIHNRGDYDLSLHEKGSGTKLDYTDVNTNETYIPHIIETSVGLGRIAMAVLISCYEEEKLEDGETRMVLKVPKHIAPISIAILPLSKKEELTKKCDEIFDILSKYFVCQYDETQSIGKRYRRQDEIGTPYCVTVDFDTLEDGAVTIRDRDTMKQERVKIDELQSKFFNLMQ